jgi:predicted ATPase
MGFEWCGAEAAGIGGQWCVVRIRIAARVRGGKLLESSAPASGGWIFFDRGLIDAAVALQHLAREPVLEEYGQAHRYHRRVFLAPPWPELYMIDRGRRHNPAAAVAEYYRLLKAYPSLGYEVSVLPRIGVVERAD